MTDDQKFGQIEGQLKNITNVLLVALQNHLNHIEIYSKQNRDMIEQSWGMAESAERAANRAEQSAKRTEKTVKAAAVFLGLVIAIVSCFT